MSVSHIQTAKNAPTGNANNVAVALGTAVAVGDVLTVFVSWDYSTSKALSSVSDDLGNTYTIRENILDTTDNQRMGAATCLVTNAGTPTVTAAFSGLVGSRAIMVEHHRSTTGFDGYEDSTGQWQASPGTGSNVVQSGSIVTGKPDLIVGGAICSSAYRANDFGEGTGFTLGDSTGDGSTINMVTEYLVQGSAGSIQATFDQNTDAQSTICMVVAWTPTAVGGVSVSLGAVSAGAVPQDLTAAHVLTLSVVTAGGTPQAVDPYVRHITGNVTLSGSPQSGVTFYLIDQATDSVIDTTTSDVNGDFAFVDVSPGTYHVVAEYSGYKAPSQSFVVVD